jgi:hypothetical protein
MKLSNDAIKNYDGEEGEVSDVPPEDAESLKFTVSKPLKIGGHLKYPVTGVDQDGDFEEKRRFSDFVALRLSLSSRWPGTYVPALPEKKVGVSNRFNLTSYPFLASFCFVLSIYKLNL